MTSQGQITSHDKIVTFTSGNYDITRANDDITRIIIIGANDIKGANHIS